MSERPRMSLGRRALITGVAVVDLAALGGAVACGSSSSSSGENSCLNPSAADIKGLPWSGAQPIQIDPGHAVIFATQRENPQPTTITTPNGSVFHFGGKGSGYIAGFASTEGTVTLDITNSGFGICEQPNDDPAAEQAALHTDVQSRLRDLKQHGFHHSTGVIVTINGDSETQEIFPS